MSVFRVPTAEERRRVWTEIRCRDCGASRAVPYRVEERLVGVTARGAVVEETVYDLECAECGSRRIGASREAPDRR